MLRNVNLPETPMKDTLGQLWQQNVVGDSLFTVPTTKNVAAGSNHNAGYSKIIRNSFLLHPVDAPMLMIDSMIFGTRASTKHIKMFGHSNLKCKYCAVTPTFNPRTAAFVPIENATARKWVKKEHDNSPPNLPSSVSTGHGPICNSLVIPKDPAIKDIKYVVQYQKKLKLVFP